MIPRIGITTFLMPNPNNGAMRYGINDTYTSAISRAGGVPLLIPNTTDDALLDAYVESLDGFLFSGGIDVSPCFYGENPHRLLGDTSLPYDNCQIPLMKKILKSGKPVIGICRGHQVLNVACGGSLYQDVTILSPDVFKHFQQTNRGDSSHFVHIEANSKLSEIFGEKAFTNSYHHQSVKMPGEGLIITAKTEDGIVEAIEMKDYPSLCIGVQWHPEAMLEAEDSMLPLFKQLISAASEYAGNK